MPSRKEPVFLVPVSSFYICISLRVRLSLLHPVFFRIRGVLLTAHGDEPLLPGIAFRAVIHGAVSVGVVALHFPGTAETYGELTVAVGVDVSGVVPFDGLL